MNKITLQIVERRISMSWFSKFIKWVTPPTKVDEARTKKGTYIADDKSTPDVNEAWEGGKAPKPKAKVTKIKK